MEHSRNVNTMALTHGHLEYRLCGKYIEHLLLKCAVPEQKRLLMFVSSLTSGNTDDLAKQVLCLAKDMELSILDYNIQVHTQNLWAKYKKVA